MEIGSNLPLSFSIDPKALRDPHSEHIVLSEIVRWQFRTKDLQKREEKTTYEQ